jgi:hypothetical protein
VDIFGSGFLPGANPSFGANISVKFVSFVDSTHLTATITPALTAASGTRNVSVVNPDGGTGVCKLGAPRSRARPGSGASRRGLRMARCWRMRTTRPGTSRSTR